MLTINNNKKSRKGRKPGNHYLKLMDTEEFIVEHELMDMFVDHPWVSELTLVENPYLRENMARAKLETKTIELSTDVMKKDVSTQRDIFVRAVCHFIANKIFNERGQGQAYQLLVQRYNRKKPKGTIKSVLPISKNSAVAAI
jgi:hypothetical protein